ncbi:MAG: hypothetical protein O7G87_15545 [bacterium]|nr:hypothetical protein [bacterium]
MLGKILIFSFLLCGLVGRGEAQSQTALLPDQERAISARIHAHFQPHLLEPNSPYRLDGAVCGTSAIMELAANWNRLSRASKRTFASVFQRPVAQQFIVSPGGRFRIHFNTAGSHAVDATDANANGTSDYVDEAAKIFDEVWELQITQMGYSPPPSDGDAFYDVYIRNLGTQAAYGFTYPEIFPENVTPSYMEVDNNFTESIYFSEGLDGLRVTAAHEFFHAIQFGYYADFGGAWWQELTATWMEDVAYPDVNDFYQYVSCTSSFSCFFDAPEKSLDHFKGTLHPFGGAVFAHHLEQVYGAESVRNVWETLLKRDPQSYSLAHIDAGMPLGGSGNVMPRFWVWNYLTDSRSRSGYYAEAADLPSIKHTKASLVSGGTFSSTGRVDYLGGAYVSVETSGISGGVRALFSLNSGATWGLMVLLIADGRVEVFRPKDHTISIPNANRFQEIVFIPFVTSTSGTRHEYSITLTAGAGISQASDVVGDFNGDVLVNFDDFLTFAQGFGKTYQESGFDQRVDLNGDGPIDFQDFLIFVSHFGQSE